MLLIKFILKQQIPIQKIAEMLCYENAGKFSSKFKDVFGVLPSKYF
ncbi:MAG: helix-turn-helix domain-containing protein [Cytophagales bacterium]|nr:MAG: helix-turn-helix domain-containing protein [Cytophagales bacterium]